jgi:predicted short-subunit dehydrogenase-like oxidoreductase (DUF2520 family)
VGRGARGRRDLAELVRGASIVLVAVPDREIDAADAALARVVARGTVVAHVAGSLGPGALGACRAAGARVAAFHPLQTFPGRRGGAARVRGSFVAIEGDPPAERALRAFARAMGLEPLALRSPDRGLYHASAVLASNATVALFDLAASQLARAARLPAPIAQRALLPLLRGTVENLRVLGLPRALSGPIARGDEATVAANLASLSADPAGREVYRALGRLAVGVARRKESLSPVAARRILRLLDGRSRSGRRA